MQSLYQNYPIGKMVLKHRIFLICMKYHLSRILFLICWLENKKQKNI